MINWKYVKYFKPKEFDDPKYPGSGENISGILLHKLTCLRERTAWFDPPDGWPLIIHSSIGGAIDMDGSWGHSKNSYHLYKPERNELSCAAVDCHFVTDAPPKIQYSLIEEIGFGGVGVYYDWKWNGKLLPIGFHLDVRPKESLQRWK
ncbi:MAG: hypothetical protein ACTSPB_19115, partial [Candidatus Thorarchaeota archaeon]